nr:Fic family protein [Endozoicomonas sp.]
AELLKQDGIKGIDQTIDGPGKSEKFFGYIYRNQNSEIVKEYIESYNTGISNCQTDDKKIRVIAELCRNLEVIHWFADGNARTIGYLLVNQLLLSNGLSPSVIKDANYFDGWSVDQLASMICEGQQKFQGLRSSSHSRE